MANFKQIGGKRFNPARGGGFSKREGDRPTFAGKNWKESGDRDRGPVTMHRATCAQCGKPCEVPFRPLSGKAVYCADCFRGKKEGEDREGGGYPQRRSSDSKSFSRPDFHGDRGDRGGENSDDFKKQLEILSVKMDRLTRAVEALVDANRLAIKERALGSEDIMPIIKDEK